MSTPPAKRLSGSEPLASPALTSADSSVADFWSWAFSDLMHSLVRAPLAEWIVAKLLRLPLDNARDAWAEHDLETPNHKTIEVKSSAYLQYWHRGGDKRSRIAFGNLRSRLYDPAAKEFVDAETYNADLYVFCVHTERDEARWDALNLDQWRFYIIMRQQFEASQHTAITLKGVEALSRANNACELTAAEFQQRALELIGD